MRVLDGIEAARFSSSVLIIGNFDGVHRGHRALLDKGLEAARAGGTELVVMTFEPHPAAVLTPDRCPATLTPLTEKLALLEAAGVQSTVVVPSQPAFFQISAESFIQDVIVKRFHPLAMVEGDGFRFGAHRKGDIDMLRAAGATHGFELHLVPPIRAALGGHPDTVISSSLIRHLIGSGNVDRAASCLGRPYALLGTIRHGAGRGRTLGYPTANLIVENQLIPAEGVYAGRAMVERSGMVSFGSGALHRTSGDTSGELSAQPPTPNPQPSAIQSQAIGEGRYAAAISIGRTPTFAENKLLIEAYLLDFDGDLYDQRMRFEFIDWIRGQQKFASVNALIEQIREDIVRVREATR